MLPAYLLTVDISTEDNSIDEEQFRKSCALCLTYLEALKGAFDNRPCAVVFSPPAHQDGKSKGWSVRCALQISLGKKRAEYLMLLYDAIVNLIAFELPDYEVRHKVEVIRFS